MLEKLNELAEKYGERTAYIYNNEKLSYAQLFERAQKAAEKLAGKDKSPVAVFGGKNPDTMAAIIACLLTKRAYVPVNTKLPEERKNRIITASNANIIIDCTGKEPVFEKTENGAQEQEENDIAYIIFTSGSTGKPKGVPISYDNLDNFIRWITNLEPMNEFEHARVFNQAEFSFDLSTAAICYALFGGHAIVQNEENGDFASVFDTIAKNKADVFVVTPTFMRMLMLSKDFCKENYPFVKCIYFCGETLQKSLADAIFNRFPDIRILNAYGPTEATSAVCAVEITKELLEHEELLPVGTISDAATEIEIESGEIVLKGKSVFSGYLGEEVGKRLVSGYKTGDIGYIHDGKLYCKGRKDSQIKYKGYRIELSEIETDISKIPGVENCAVIAKKNPEGEVKMIKALFSGNAEENFIRKELSEKLPDYMIPKTIRKLSELPMNKNGKTDRKELEKL